MNDEQFDDDVLEEDDMSDALQLDDLAVAYIGNPKVGESITLKMKKMVKLTGDSCKGKTKDGTAFTKALSSVPHGYEIVTDKGSKYTIPGWEVFGKLKSIFHKLGKTTDVDLRITHILDGMKSENKKLDKYNVETLVEDEWKSLNRESREWN